MIKKEKYTHYFQVLIDELREQHNFTTARKAQACNYFGFASGVSEIKYYAKFGQGEAYTAINTHFREYEKNKNFFDVLKERKSVINAKFDGTLYWYRRDDINTCVIAVRREGDIDSDTLTLDAIRKWNVENLLKFKEVFTPEIQRARERL